MANLHFYLWAYNRGKDILMQMKYFGRFLKNNLCI